MKFNLLVSCIALPLIVGFLGSVVTLGSISTWYATLAKPFFSPPNYLFAPVWTTLYILMGIAFYLVLQSRKHKQAAIRLFLLQLFLNFLWSLVFFGFHQIFEALVVIVFLWLSILLTIKEFFKHSKVGGHLLLPYIFWVSFAAVLNLSLYLLNR